MCPEGKGLSHGPFYVLLPCGDIRPCKMRKRRPTEKRMLTLRDLHVWKELQRLSFPSVGGEAG